MKVATKARIRTAPTASVNRQRSVRGRRRQRATGLSAAASRTARREPVADRAHRDDRGRRAGAPELASQVADVDLDDVGSRIVRVAPYGAEDLLAREHVAGMSQEVREQVELLRRQRDLD